MQGMSKKRNWAVIVLLGIGMALAALSLAETLRKVASMRGVL